MGEKALWDAAHVKLFCEICASEVLAGHRPLGHLNKVGWKNVEAKFAEKSGRKLEHLQLKNKWDNLKRSYTIFMELKNSATGLGWNEIRQTVDCDDRWWEDHLARCHDPSNGRKCKHMQFRKCGPANLDSLHIMFGSAHVTGASASTPGDLSSNSTDDDVHEIEKSSLDAKLPTMQNHKDKKHKASSSTCMEEKEDKSPFLRLYKQTCSKIEEGVEKISTSVEASSAPSMINQVPTIAEAMKMLKQCGVEEGTALMHTATLLIIKPEIRELLGSFETLEGRLDWLKREHEMKNLMDPELEELVQKGYKGLQLVAELSKQAATIGYLGDQYSRRYLNKNEVVNHTCRHGYTSQNVMAICDFDMRFTFVVAGWPGSAHDTRILNHALTNFGDRFPKPPTGKYYLVDSGYPNRTGYLAPYKGSTYHLPKFNLRRHRAPQGKYEMFNYLHSSLRNIIERAFGVLKQKWRILKSIPSFSPKRQKHIIIACMALHNFIRDSALRDDEFEKCDKDEDYMPEDEDNNDGQQAVELQGDDAPEEENEVTMNTIRDNIANALVS